MSASRRGAPRWAVAAALAVVYLVWGSTYAGIRVALDGLPPFLLAGTRFLTAGALALLFAGASGRARLSRRQVRQASLVGVLLLACGNGGVVWAEQHVATGLAAVLIATVPLWMVGIDALHPGGERLTPGVLSSFLLGLGGVVLLMAGGIAIGRGHAFWLGVAALLFAAFAWAGGSIYGRHAEKPSSFAAYTGIEMLAGGGVMTLLGTLDGEWGRIDAATLIGPPLWAQLYLVLFGSLLAFSAYVWLLRAAPPALVGTYAYVNPVVAIVLGIVLFDESLDRWTLAGSAIILASVLLAQLARLRGASGKGAPPAGARLPAAEPDGRTKAAVPAGEAAGLLRR